MLKVKKTPGGGMESFPRIEFESTKDIKIGEFLGTPSKKKIWINPLRVWLSKTGDIFKKKTGYIF